MIWLCVKTRPGQVGPYWFFYQHHWPHLRGGGTITELAARSGF